LSVDGELLVDDMHALVVKGRVTCRSFWVGEGRFRAAELDASDVCTFACHADDMQFEADRVSTAILCTRKGEKPSGLAIEAKHTIDTASLEDEKLLGWILDDASETVLAALDSGATIDDAWCASHEDLVTNVERRAMLAQAHVPPRVRKILEDVAAGATIHDTEVGGRPAVCVVLADGSKRIAVLTPDERAALARGTTARHG